MLNWIKQNGYWLLPTLVLVAMGPFALTNIDSTRDFIMAKRLVTGEAWTWLGPQLAFSFHIGPWWYYLMTIPVSLSDSWLGMAVFVAALNALKFFLAFQLGCLIKDRHLGLWMVAGLLLISMTTMQSITFTHTSVVESSMLLMLYVCWQTQLRSHWHWLLLGGITTLAFHAHPTAVLAGYFALLWWLKHPNKLTTALSFVVGVLMLASPLLYLELSGNSQLTSGVNQYFNQHGASIDWMALPKLWWGFWISAPIGMLGINLPGWLASTLWLGQLGLLLVAAVVPWLLWSRTNSDLKRWYVHSWVFFVLTSIGLVLIRSLTPWYMTYGLSLAWSLVAATGWYLVFQTLNLQSFRRITQAWLLLVFVFLNGSLVLVMNNGQIRLPATLLHDLKTNDHNLTEPGFEFPAWQAKLHASKTCAQTPVSVHGPYAVLLFTHSGMEHLAACAKGLHYGPHDQHPHILGVPSYFSPMISAPVIDQIGHTDFYQPIDINPQQSHWAETFEHDYERRFDPKPQWAEHHTTINLSGGQHLIITRLLAYKMQIQIKEVLLNGKPIEAVSSNNYSHLYRCDACDPDRTEWHVKYTESIAGMTNIVTF